MTTLKVSLCLFFLRIMVSKRQRYIIYSIAAFSTVFGTAYFFYGLLQCGAPVESELFWKKRILGLCVQRGSILGMSYTHAIVSAATDLSLAVLPIPMIVRAKITRNEKFIVVGILTIAVTYVDPYILIITANCLQWCYSISYSYQVGSISRSTTILSIQPFRIYHYLVSNRTRYGNNSWLNCNSSALVTSYSQTVSSLQVITWI
jgi:hypothetical protein